MSAPNPPMVGDTPEIPFLKIIQKLLKEITLMEFLRKLHFDNVMEMVTEYLRLQEIGVDFLVAPKPSHPPRGHLCRPHCPYFIDYLQIFKTWAPPPTNSWIRPLRLAPHLFSLIILKTFIFGLAQKGVHFNTSMQNGCERLLIWFSD